MSYTLAIKLCVCDLPNFRLPAKYILCTIDILHFVNFGKHISLIIQPRSGDKIDNLKGTAKRSSFVLPRCFLLVRIRQTTVTTKPIKKMTETTPSAVNMYRKVPASVAKHILVSFSPGLRRD